MAAASAELVAVAVDADNEDDEDDDATGGSGSTLEAKVDAVVVANPQLAQLAGESHKGLTKKGSVARKCVPDKCWARRASHSRRSAALSSRGLELNSGHALEASLLRTMPKGRPHTRLIDAHSSL